MPTEPRKIRINYKCRVCGEVFHVPGHTAIDDMGLMSCITSLIDKPNLDGLYEIHRCANGYGVADLIGVQ